MFKKKKKFKRGSIPKTPASLAKKLTKKKEKDREKCWAIFDWIAHNIVYDVDSFFNNSYESQDPEHVLKTGRSVCGGIANLFASVAKEAGLEVVTIHGYAKGYGYKAGDSLKKNETNHAWNAVKINNKWQLIDSTWGSGQLGENNQHEFKFQPFYFCTPPHQLIYSHFPEDNRWQLLNPPKSAKEFVNLPQVFPSFFQHNIETVNASHGCLNGKGQLKLRFRTPNNVLLSAVLIDPNGREERDLTLTQSENDEKVVYSNFRQKGKHILRIFSRKKDKADDSSSNHYQQSSSIAMAYSINVSTIDPSVSTFPETTGTFAEANVQLDQPKSRHLNANDFQLFRIAAPQAKDVYIIQNDQWHHLKRRKGWFEGEVYVKSGSAKLIARFNSTNRYWQLAEYTVA